MSTPASVPRRSDEAEVEGEVPEAARAVRAVIGTDRTTAEGVDAPVSSKASEATDAGGADLIATAGLGRRPAEPITTLPPIDELAPRIPISPNTGQPPRHPVMVLANVFLYGAAGASAASLAKAWWDAIHMPTFPTAAHLIELINPRPGSPASIIAVVLMTAIGVIMVATPAITAFNSWNGHWWSRIAALISIAVAGLAWFMNPIGYLALPLSTLGAILLWLPPVGRYFEQWRLFRTPERPPAPPITDVRYGSLARFV